jgi:Farnesoic acid 0-methyl transferase
VITFWDERVIFNVKACNDARIMLQTIPGSTVDKHYEVVIGGWSNTRSVIRSSQQVNITACELNDASTVKQLQNYSLNDSRNCSTI